jgi:twinkle protein
LAELEKGRFVRNTLCPSCGSSRGLSVYQKTDHQDGYCFVCEKHFKFGEHEYEREEGDIIELMSAEDLPILELRDRGIKQYICEHYGVRVSLSETTGEIVEHYYPYYNLKGDPIWKIRKLPKSFRYSAGSSSGIQLFGRQLAGDGGKLLVLTEGELDCLALYQVLRDKGKNYRVCSIPNGSKDLANLKCNLDWLEAFDTIILCFDQDTAGQEGAQAIAELLTPGKCKLMTYSEKDACKMLEVGKEDELFRAVFTAKSFHPAGIVSGAETWELIRQKQDVECILYPEGWGDFNHKTYGIRLGELDTWTSGSGSGKTQMIRELQYHLFQNTTDNIGVIALEEPITDSIEALMSLHLGKRIHLPDVRANISDDELYSSWLDTVGTNRFHFYDHFGSVDEDSLLSKIRYLARALDCKYIFLDHLSIVVSEFAAEGDERTRIDTVMTKLKKLTQELGIWIGLIVHLRKVSGGKSFEEGAVPSVDDLRGCVDRDTEFLSSIGWKRISEYTEGDQVAEFNLESHEVKFKEPEAYIKQECDWFYHLKSCRGIDQVVSEEHTIIYQHNEIYPNLHKISARDLVEKHEISAKGYRGRFLTTFKYNGEGLDLTDDELRLEIACQADGHVRVNKYKPSYVAFMFKKKRKYERLLNLCQRAGVEYQDFGKLNSGVFYVKCYLKWQTKLFNDVWYTASSSQLETIADEVFYWDGDSVSRNRYFTTKKQNADYIQFVFASIGVRSTISLIKTTGVYKVTISGNKTVSLVNKDQKIPIEIVPSEDGYKYCFTTSTGAFVARRNGRVFITGNSGAIKQLSNNVYAITRNQQAPEALERNKLQLHVLKNRFTGRTGPSDYLFFNEDTGRIIPFSDVQPSVEDMSL